MIEISTNPTYQMLKVRNDVVFETHNLKFDARQSVWEEICHFKVGHFLMFAWFRISAGTDWGLLTHILHFLSAGDGSGLGAV